MNLFLNINYVAVLISSLIYFFIGAVWYSPLLISKIWVEELKKNNVAIKQPSQTDMVKKMLYTFGVCFITSLAMAYLVSLTNSMTAFSGLHLGILTALGFAATSIGSVFIWENKTLKLFLLDVGYPILGIISSAVLLSLWH